MKTHISFIMLAVALSFFSCKNEQFKVEKIKAIQVPIDSTIAMDTSIDDFVKPFRENLNKQLDSTLCISAFSFSKTDGALETSMGNLMADISLAETKEFFKKKFGKEIDMVLFNHGGVRASLPKGNISARNAFQVMPFENELVVTELSYEKILELVLYFIKEKKAHPTAKMELIVNKGTNAIEHLKINNREVVKGETYLVLTTDYLQDGGDRMYFFTEPIQLYKTGYKLRNVLIDNFKKTDTLQGVLDNRVSYAK